MRKQAQFTQDAAAVLQKGRWAASEVAALLDVPEVIVTRWAQTGLIPGAAVANGRWMLPGRGLFFFLGRRVEAHYSVATVAAMLDRPAATVRDWIASGRLRVVKLGTARSAATLIPESSVLDLLQPERRRA